MVQWKSMFRWGLAILVCMLLARVSEAQEPKAEVSGAAEVAHDKAEHSQGEHHIDPANSNLSDSGPDPAEWRSEMSIATAIVFGVLLFFLTAYAWRPIAEGLEKREKSIAMNIKSAEDAALSAAAKLAEYEKKLAEAAQEAQRIVAEARKDAETAGQRLLATAQEEASRQRERAVAEIDSAKRVALNELAQQSTEVAVTLAQRIVGREVKANDHQGLIQDMLGKMPSKN
jgi:F-type H+-transporting ATPase subunit b